MRYLTVEEANEHLVELQKISNDFYAPKSLDQRWSDFPRLVRDLRNFARNLRQAMQIAPYDIVASKGLTLDELNTSFAVCLGCMKDVIIKGNKLATNISTEVSEQDEKERFRNFYINLAIIESNVLPKAKSMSR